MSVRNYELLKNRDVECIYTCTYIGSRHMLLNLEQNVIISID